MNGVGYRSTDGGTTFVALDADPAAAHRGPRRARRRALPGRQELQRRLGAGDVARRGRDRHSRCHATTTCAASGPARRASAATRASSSRARRVWTNDVCTGALLDGGVRTRRPPAAAAGCAAAIARVRRRRWRPARAPWALALAARARLAGAAAQAPSGSRARSPTAIARQSTARSVSLVFVLHTVLQTAYPYKAGPIAQRSELAAHNRLVPGSNPGGPTLDPWTRRRYVHTAMKRAAEEPELRDQLKRLEELQRHDAKIQELESSLRAIPDEARRDRERPGARRRAAEHRAAGAGRDRDATTPSRRA